MVKRWVKAAVMRDNSGSSNGVETKTALAASLMVMVPAATRFAREVRDSNGQQQQAI